MYHFLMLNAVQPQYGLAHSSPYNGICPSVIVNVYTILHVQIHQKHSNIQGMNKCKSCLYESPWSDSIAIDLKCNHAMLKSTELQVLIFNVNLRMNKNKKSKLVSFSAKQNHILLPHQLNLNIKFPVTTLLDKM